MKTQKLLVWGLAGIAACAPASRLMAVSPKPIKAPLSTTKANVVVTDPLAEIWQFTDSEGHQIGLVLRVAQPADLICGKKLVTHAVLGGSKLAILAVQWPDGNQIQWGDPQKPVAYWSALEAGLVTVLDTVQHQATTPLPAQQPAPGKPVTVQHPIPFLTVANVSSEALRKGQSVTCVIFAVTPAKVTAVACIGASGLVALDALGGNKGLKYICIGPVGPGLILPNDPKTFVVNAATTAINPLKQAKLYEKSLQQIVRAIPGGKDAVAAVRDGVIRPIGDVKILGTTPSKAVEAWQKDPVAAAAKTAASLGNTPINGGGATLGHAVEHWTSDPVGAAGRTIESLNPF